MTRMPLRFPHQRFPSCSERSSSPSPRQWPQNRPCQHCTSSRNLRIKPFFGKVMGSENLTIGALATRTQCSVPTIRYYEEIGLLPQAARSANGRRYYSDADHRRRLFIKRCRDFGFPIGQVRSLVSLFEDRDRSCAEVRDMMKDHLMQVRARIEELQQLGGSLGAFAQSCDEACVGGVARDCTIIGDLSTQSSTQGGRSCCSTSREFIGESASAFHEVRRR